MQLRALTILDGLIQNAGSRFQRVFADEPLLERLRVAATDPLSDEEVKQRCQLLFRQWAVSYKATPGMDRIAALYKQLPQRKKPARQDQSKVLQETEPEAEGDPFNSPNSVSASGKPSQLARSPPSASTSSRLALSPGPSLTPRSQAKHDKHGKKVKTKPFNLDKEKPQLLQTIASSSVASTNLMNALKLINREHKQISEDPETLQGFETCKVLRRQILRYIQHVESEQWLGSLIHANDELVNALMAFEILDKSIDDDSDSENDEWDADDDSNAKSKARHHELQDSFAGLSFGPSKTQKPGMSISMPSVSRGRGPDEDEDEEDYLEEEDDNDPFADSNAVHTPKVERPGMTW